MNKFVCFFIFFIGFCDCACVGDDHEEKYIRRPCPKYDLGCIRDYFAKNSECFPAYGKVPDPYYMSQLSLPLANANLTLEVIKAQTIGLNGKVVEFYVNKLTDKVVLAVELRDLTIFSDEVNYIYHRKAKEPVVKSHYSGITYTSVTLTAVLPNTPNLQLYKAEFNAFIDDPKPRYIIGPNLSRDSDPLVSRSYTHFETFMNENVREAFIVQAPLYMNLFIQKRICNFGLKVPT